MITLFDAVQTLKGVGPRRDTQLQKLGIMNIWDLLWHLPRTYFDQGAAVPVKSAAEQPNVTVIGTIERVWLTAAARGMKIARAVLSDDTGSMELLWFNQPYILNAIKQGDHVAASGRTRTVKTGIQMAVSRYETYKDGQCGTTGLIPVYQTTAGLPQKTMRSLVNQALENYFGQYPQIVPQNELDALQMLPVYQALETMHHPVSDKEIEKARRSLALEELFLFQLFMLSEKNMQQRFEKNGYRHNTGKTKTASLLHPLPFGLTGAQRRVIKEVLTDMKSQKPMNRLIHGDVGSGKTVIAAAAMAVSAANGYQACMMVPTALLAQQQYQKVKQMFREDVQIELLTGNTAAAERRRILESVRKGETQILIGTHAVIEETVRFNELSLVVIDEQHRFGVRQRSRLGKKGALPDVLVMSATPIPRTMALTLYGDLDVSVLDEQPPGRTPIKTTGIRAAEREKAYRFVLSQIKTGRQAYAVCPLIEESEKLEAADVVSLYKYLNNGIFKEKSVGLLHGRMKNEEKEAVMNAFVDGKLDLLVSTTVIEVGVDVTNATVMVIENADRFGLSQLHQLRGRVGRGADQAYCILIGDPATPEGKARLQIMKETGDGFLIASEDLQLRGPGDIWGIRQRGLPTLKAADLFKDTDLIEISRNAAQQYISSGKRNDTIEAVLQKRFGANEEISSN